MEHNGVEITGCVPQFLIDDNSSFILHALLAELLDSVAFRGILKWKLFDLPGGAM